MPAEMQNYNSKLYIQTSLYILGIALVASFLIFSPYTAEAALVPCGGEEQPACEVCHLYNLANNVIKFALWDIATPLLVVALLAAGILWLTSGGSEDKLAKGKTILFSAVIGFLIVFGAWVIINTLLSTLGYDSWWNNTDLCSQSPIRSDSGPGPTEGAGPITPTEPPIVGGTMSHIAALQQLQGAGISVVSTNGRLGCNEAGCTNLQGIQAEAIQDAINLKNACNCTVIVGGGTETGSGHTENGNCTHLNGCKLDFQSNAALNTYIRSTYTRIQNRGDGAEQFRNDDGTIYAWENNPPHWDMSAR